MFRRCVECELVVMPRPFMVCDNCAQRNDRMNARIQWATSTNSRTSSGQENIDKGGKK